MPSVVLNVSNFNYYAFHPKSSDLSKKDQKTALVSTILMGVFTLGLGHLVCAVVYGIKSSLAKKVSKVAEPIISNEPGKKTDDKRELRPQTNSNFLEIPKEKPNPSSITTQATTADEKPQTNSIPLESPKKNPNTPVSTVEDDQMKQDFKKLPEFDLSTLGTSKRIKVDNNGKPFVINRPNFIDDQGFPIKEIFFKTEKIEGDIIRGAYPSGEKGGFRYFIIKYLDENNKSGVFFVMGQLRENELVRRGWKIPQSGDANDLNASIELISLDKTGKVDRDIFWSKFDELLEKGQITGTNPNYSDPITIKLKSKG